MKFYSVKTDDYLEVFKKKSLAIKLLKELKVSDPDGYDRITYDCMEIYIDSDTVLDILNGNGYASEILELNKP